MSLPRAEPAVDRAGMLLRWFERHGRSQLPWRRERTPYRVVVSEFMLQQTQVDRVVPLFERFVATYDSFSTLAAAPLADVVRLWKGLGYNSRAMRLHGLARAVTERFGGEVPRDERALRSLPGVGPYTARAIAAFAFDEAVVALDTNIRRIVHRTHLGLEWPPLASDRELDALAPSFVRGRGGFAVNSALMDLGSALCMARAPRCLLCPLAPACAAAPIDPALLAERSRAFAPKRGPQERLPFERTTRYLRGRIIDRLRELPAHASISLLDLERDLATLAPEVEAPADAVLEALVREGFVERTGLGVRLRS